MVDTTEAMESQYMTIKYVKENKVKTMVVIDGGDYEDSKFGKRLKLTVNTNGRSKIWNPNTDSVKNLQLYGKDSKDWVGKLVLVNVISINGKENLIASPDPSCISAKEEILNS